MSLTYYAGGNIAPARFVCMPDSGGMTNDYTAIQASDPTLPTLIGISPPYTRYAPGTPFDNGYSATAGQDIMVNSAPENCEIECGAAVQSGDLLMTDSNGRAVTCTTTKYFGARALSTASASGTRVMVVIMPCGYMA